MERKKNYYRIVAAALSVAMLTGCSVSGTAVGTSVPQNTNQSETGTGSGSAWQPEEDTERTRRAYETYQELFGDMELDLNGQSPDFVDIMNNFIYGDVYHQSDLLTVEERELVTLVTLTTQQSYELLKQHAVGALNAGLTPEEVMEAVIHCSPYVGMATTYDAVSAVADAFEENGTELPLPSQTMVSDEERYAAGAAAQNQLFGLNPQPGTDDITDYVTAWCFGDFYTRGSLPIETHEMLTMCILANMGVQQFGGHVRGTYNAGYSKEKILAIVAQMMPYMGTPRTLNAVSTVNEILPDETMEETEMQE